MLSSMELLAPAGDLKIFKSAIDAGADAVYFGGDFFGARASAKNFSISDAKNALEYAHLRGKKAYLTVNTLLKNPEMESKLYDFMKEYYESGIDGVIIQDFGVFTFLKDHFPELELHASTQMSLMSKYGAKFLKDQGASRIVTARELSLAEIKEIHENVDVEIEAFVHGALCVCYSGNCLMSSFIGGRSGNRGYCAQPCRLPYEICDGNKKSIYGKEKYHLSPKDLWGIHDLPGMLDAGVYSYKIEGRLKNEAYVTNVVCVYRKYMDVLLSEGAKDYRVDEKDIKRLMDAGNRGVFTNLYFHERNGKALMNEENSAFYQENKKPAVSVIKESNKTKLFGEFIAHVGQDLTFSVWDENGNCKTVSSVECEESTNKPTSKEDILEKLNAVGDLPYVFEEISVFVDENSFVPLKFVKQMRRDALFLFQENKINRETKPFLSLNEKEFLKENKNENPRVRIGVTTYGQLLALEEANFDFSVVLNAPLWLSDEENALKFKTFGKDFYISLPPVIRKDHISLISEKVKEYMKEAKGFYALSYDGLALLESLGVSKEMVYFGDRLYAYSNRAVYAFFRLGYKHTFVPLELNEKELIHRYNENSEVLLYGYVPLMYTANCISKITFGCKKNKNEVLYLKDRKNAFFPVMNQCKICTNVIYNSLPMITFDRHELLEGLNPKSVRVDFTIEDKAKVKEVLDLFEKIYLHHESDEIMISHTKGHLKRGVL